jgi:hypothetical protein
MMHGAQAHLRWPQAHAPCPMAARKARRWKTSAKCSKKGWGSGSRGLAGFVVEGVLQSQLGGGHELLEQGVSETPPTKVFKVREAMEYLLSVLCSMYRQGATGLYRSQDWSAASLHKRYRLARDMSQCA